jgi:pSer/pThr/pTyr-binding forkhead associated (FHA) protein
MSALATRLRRPSNVPLSVEFEGGATDVLEVVTGDMVRTVDLMGGRVTIGRGEDNDVILEGDARASRQHAVLTSTEGLWRVSDQNSTNGTYVNSVRISAPVEVKVGDCLHLGSTAILFAARNSHSAVHGYIDLDARVSVSEL